MSFAFVQVQAASLSGELGYFFFLYCQIIRDLIISVYFIVYSLVLRNEGELYQSGV